MSTVQKTMQLQPEYIEKFIKDILANVYQVDEETGEVTGIAATSPLFGKPVFDEDGNPVYQVDPETGEQVPVSYTHLRAHET